MQLRRSPAAEALGKKPSFTPLAAGVIAEPALAEIFDGRALAEGDLEEDTQIKLLVVSSLLLALGVGVLADLVISWSLGPSWATSLGFMAALGGFVLSLAGRRDS